MKAGWKETRARAGAGPNRGNPVDLLFTGFIVFALIVEALRISVNRPYTIFSL
jgi:hypothetical protein